MTQMELNKRLCDASLASELDISKVEDLLKMGADPLGYFNADEDYTLDRLFVEGQERDRAKNLPLLVNMFLRYGMSVESSEDDVLYCLTWVRNEFGVQALKALLDAGLSAALAEEFIAHLVGDILLFDISPLTDDAMKKSRSWIESIEYAMAMVLVAASYKKVFLGSRYIRELLGAKGKDANKFARFKEWEKYRYSLEVDNCSNCHISVFDIATEKRVWKFKLIGYLQME